MVKCYCSFVCRLVHMFILVDDFLAVNDLQGYFVITASDSDSKSILILLPQKLSSNIQVCELSSKHYSRN